MRQVPGRHIAVAVAGSTEVEVRLCGSLIALPDGQLALSDLAQLPDLPIDPLGLRPIAWLMQAPGGLRKLEPG